MRALGTEHGLRPGNPTGVDDTLAMAARQDRITCRPAPHRPARRAVSPWRQVVLPPRMIEAPSDEEDSC